MHLHATIDNRLCHQRNADLASGNQVHGFFCSDLVHLMAGFKHQQAHHLDLRETLGNIFAHGLMLA